MFAARLGVLPILALALCSAGTAQGKTVEYETRFGSVALVEEIQTRDPGQPPALHFADEWTKLRLRWRAPLGDFMVELVDDGYQMQFVLSGHDCTGIWRGLRYRRSIGETELWTEMRGALASLMADCPGVTRAQAAQYRSAFAATRDDHVPAVEAMKRRAATIFRGSLARCVRFEEPGGTGLTQPFNPHHCLTMR